MFGARNPGSRVSGMLKEQHTKEYRTSQNYENRYCGSWASLNPFQSPPRGRGEWGSEGTPSPARSNETTRLELPRISATTPRVPMPPATPAISGQGVESSLSPFPPRCGTAQSESQSPPRSLACTRRVYHNLRHSDARTAFYDSFIAKPQYSSKLALL
jgi:hypothetical protein